MNRMCSTLVLAVLVTTPLGLAQPAKQANPPPLTPECQKLHDDFLKLQQTSAPARDDSRMGDGSGQRGARAGSAPANPELKAAREQYQQRCGELTPDMTRGADGGKKGNGKPSSLAEAMAPRPKEPTMGPVPEPTAVVAAAAPAQPVATAPAGAAAHGAPPAQPHDPPRKAGPASGTGSGSKRCAQLHQSMKDALQRKDACAKKDKQCKNGEQLGYEQLRSAYQSGCGELPDDAKPSKKKKG